MERLLTALRAVFHKLQSFGAVFLPGSRVVPGQAYAACQNNLVVLCHNEKLLKCLTNVAHANRYRQHSFFCFLIRKRRISPPFCCDQFSLSEADLIASVLKMNFTVFVPLSSLPAKLLYSAPASQTSFRRSITSVRLSPKRSA